MSNIKIILVVNTDGLTKAAERSRSKRTKLNVGRYCTFYDNSADITKQDPKKYVTYAQPGQIIEWSGTTEYASTCDCVSIDSIVYNQKKKGKNNFDLFGVPVLIARDGEITASILGQEGSGEEEEYTINFSVIRNNDGSNASYSIDPKIHIDT